MTIPQLTALVGALFTLLIGALAYAFRSTISHFEGRLNSVGDRVDRLSDVSRLFGEQIAVSSSSNRSDGARLESIHRDLADMRERVASLEAKIDTLIAGSFPHRMPGPP